ncbi:MAG: penicillin-binding transpeptidase domain-containing protein, partial [Ilumatobacteraceae bacterium]
MAADKRAARFGILALVGVMLLGLVGVRLWFLQTVRAEELQERVTFSKTRTVDLLPERGRIFDVDGRILADNQRILTVAVDRQVIRRERDREELFRRLSGWIEVPVEEMERRYEDPLYSPFLPLPLREDVDERTAIALLERSEDFPGVTIETESRRVYPYAPLAAHVVGYMGAITAETLDSYLDRGYNRNERVGQFGVELSMEDELHGQWGRRVYEVDAANRPVRLIEEVPPINGFDIQLSIDLELQRYVEQAVQTSLEARRGEPAPNPEVVKPNGERERLDPTKPEEVPFPAPAGSAVVMNYETGEVAALSSFPTFDNRWFEVGISGDKFKQLFPVTDDPDKSILVNRAVQGRYNLGSTFKPFPMYAALNTGLITPWEVYDDHGEYRMQYVDQDRCDAGLIRCTYRNALCGNGRPCTYGEVDAIDALAVSSDGYFYRIGEEIMALNDMQPVLQEQVRLWGFGEQTGIDLPFEFAGTVPDQDLKRRYAEIGVISEDEGRGYYVGDNVQLAIGQGLLSATPLQLANGYGAIANDGRLVQPQVVRAIYEPGVPNGDIGYADLAAGRIHEAFSGPEIRRDIELPSEIRDVLVTGLSRVVRPGGGSGLTSTITGMYHRATGENLFYDYPADALPLAGKTGTAQGRNNYPWNDSSAFVAFSRDREQPYVMSAYL